jgi:GTP-binding protein Era
MQSEKFRSGYVSLTGRPNVGKSTLLNAIIGEKIAIVTPKPQTTRNRITGIKNLDNAQIVFIDTPGIHKPQHKLGEIIVKEAKEAVREVDIILFMVEPEFPGRGDKFILDILNDIDKPVILLINKIDKIKKNDILPLIDTYRRLYPFKEIIPISALKGDGVNRVIDAIVSYLPEGPMYYPEDITTDQIERFMSSEIIREKIMDKTEEEVPYSIAVDIIDWKEHEDKKIFIHADIYVEREGQKGIIIGKGGAMLKEIGTKARLDIERLLGTKVFLELRVKIKKDWRSNKHILRELGYK